MVEIVKESEIKVIWEVSSISVAFADVLTTKLIWALIIFLLSKIVEGSGTMVVCAVGIHSFNGNLKLTLQSTDDKTPLQ